MSPHRKTPWLTADAADAIRLAATLALSRRLDGVAAAREVAWSRHPALPARMISEAVAAVIADGEELHDGLSARSNAR